MSDHLALVEAAPPSAVQHCVEARLTAHAARDLVVARATHLELYTLRELPPPSPSAPAAGTGAGPSPAASRAPHDGVAAAYLARVAQLTLNGVVVALRVLPRQPRDALLLAFADAKLATLEFDLASHRLRTRAVHSFEAVGEAVGCRHVPRPLLSVTAGCAALLAYGSHLFVLPLRADATIAGAPADPCALPPESASANAPLGAPPGEGRGALAALGVRASSTSWFRLSLAALGLHHVRDMAFLVSSLEPTLAVLCEPEQIVGGRPQLRANTCKLVALALRTSVPVEGGTEWGGDISQLWALLQLPAPVGGVLVLSDNVLFWLNHGARFGLALNRDARGGGVPLRPVGGPLRVSLRGATAAVMAGTSPMRVCISTASGDLLLAIIEADGRRAPPATPCPPSGIVRMPLLKAAASVPAAAICPLGHRYLFLGSAVADSMLLQIGSEPRAAAARPPPAPSPPLSAAAGDEEEHAAKRVKLEEGGEGEARGEEPPPAAGGEEGELDEAAEEEELYGEANPLLGAGGKEHAVMARLPVVLRDSLPSTAPITDVASVSTGGERGRLQLLVCGGRGRSGSLSRMCPGIADFPLAPCNAMFTIRFDAEANVGADGSAAGGEAWHSMLLLSEASRTRVLQTGEEITEISAATGFFLQGPTLLLAPLEGGELAVQAYASGVRLLRRDQLLAASAAPAGRTIARASAAADAVLALFSDGGLWLLRVAADGKSLVESPPPPLPPLVAACAFLDAADFFGEREAEEAEAEATGAPRLRGKAPPPLPSPPLLPPPLPPPRPPSHPTPLPSPFAFAAASLDLEADGADLCEWDDEDAALYSAAPRRRESPPAAPPPPRASRRVLLCACCSEHGELSIWRLPLGASAAWARVFRSAELLSAPAILSDAAGASRAKPAPVLTPRRHASPPHPPPPPPVPQRAEARLLSLREDNSRPVLALLLSSSTLLLYRATPPSAAADAAGPADAAAAAPRFVRVAHPLLPSRADEAAPRAPLPLAAAPPRLVACGRLGGAVGGVPYGVDGGVLLLGERPALLCLLREALWAHALRAPGSQAGGSVQCAAPFHNPNCAHGLVLMGPDGLLQICGLVPPPAKALPTRYDAAWPLAKLPLRATPHAVVPLPQHRALLLSVSHSNARPESEAARWEAEGAELEGVAALPPPVRHEEVYELQLLDEQSWERVARFALQPHEWVMSAKLVQLRDESVTSAKVTVSFVAVGTAIQLGEDELCRGRLLLFEVGHAPADAAADDAPADGDPTRQLRLVSQVEERGPVLAIGQLQGQLLAAAGSKLMMWSYRDRTLNASGFYDADYAIASIATLHNIVLIGDLHAGLRMVRWKHNTQTFDMVSKAAATKSTYACEFLFDKAKSSLLLAIAEDKSRLRLFADASQSTDASRGNQLQPRAAFQLGAQVNRLLRLTLPTPPAAPAASAAGGAAAKLTRHALLWATLQGSVGFLSPIDESTFRRLSFLATKMVAGVPHAAGLNPRAFRAHDAGATSAQELKSILDGALLSRFTALDCEEQDTLAQQIGTTPHKLLTSMIELEVASALF
ncbi:hypothetical protein AB1Y20_002601 [Prymnesium parvum]|uniref:DNA damage-binding protein 1 n=1 Tax=Prymnesium parvum TaxID=97485 RepID=A0AB34JBN3_PRYPA